MDAPHKCRNSVDAWAYLKRKTEAIKARERREEIEKNIASIEGGHVNDTIIPVPSEHQPAYFAKLESNGIWRLVLRDLVSLSDITSACCASNYFRDHLEERRISMLPLLPQVFGILRKGRFLHFCNPYNPAETSGDVLTLRLVSKSSKEAAEEQFLFSTPDWHLRKRSGANDMIVSSPLSCTIEEGEEIEDVERANDTLRTSYSCSALLKVINIDVGQLDPSRKKGFRAKLGELLDIHGEHVWAVHFKSWFEYKDLWTAVTRTPHLKELSLDYYEESLESHRVLLARYQFPTIPSLTKLIVSDGDGDSDVPEFQLLIAEIVRRNPNLKTVSILCNNSSYLREIIPTLANLQLECFDFNLGDENGASLAHLQLLVGMEWPLKVLNLSGAYSLCPSGTVNARDLFGIINHFNDTLEEIDLGAMILKDDGRSVVVHFPSLKTIGKVWATLV